MSPTSPYPPEEEFASAEDAARYFARVVHYITEEYARHATHEEWCKTVRGEGDAQCSCGYAKAIVVALKSAARSARYLGYSTDP